MGNRKRRLFVKAAGLLFLLLVLALFPACSGGADPSSAETAAEGRTDGSGPETGNGADAASRGAEGSEPRTDQIFDRNRFQDELKIYYLHLTGKEVMGDSILIVTPDGKTMLIDGGLPGAGGQVAGYAKKLGIGRIDIALNTHPHSDHIGGFAAIPRFLEIGEFYMERLPYPGSKPYENAMAALQEKQIPIKYLERGDTFQLGSEVRFEVLNPPKGSLDKVDPSDLPAVNSHSLVLKLIYKGQSFLFTGDIYKDREQELIETMGAQLNALAMHVPHHGSTTSSGFAFMQAVKPQVAVISNNHFQNLDLLRLYKAQKTNVYITDKHGNILLTFDGKRVNVITEKDWLDPPAFLK
jgi:beta-lactamase superfamily II metal-dependent hydrolase